MAFLVFQPISKADEGMWPPFMIPDMLFNEMDDKGLNLTPELLFSFTETSLKDAIVSFGGFCTGGVISDKGLILTNHHCGYRQLQSHSSVEDDYLNNGFWAASHDEELPNPGLYVRFLVNVEDVTERVTEGLDESFSEAKRDSIISARRSEIIASTTEDSHYKAQVKSLFAGNEYYLFIYEDYTDVRLVGSPPNSIGKFGGDTDNWMWPRHTGDFMLFRAYSGPDGKPADYSEDNIPLKPRYHLPISLKGYTENDFAMIFGYAGRTERYLTSHGINFNLEEMYPIRIDIRRKKLDIMEEAMAQSDKVRIQYASKHAGVANYWKYFIGMSTALKKHNVASEKKELEKDFMSWVNEKKSRKKEYGKTMELFAESYEGQRKLDSYSYIYAEALATGPEIFRLALSAKRLNNVLGEEDKEEQVDAMAERLKSSADRIYEDLNLDVDRKMWAEMTKMYYENVSSEWMPEIFNEIAEKFNNDFYKFADHVYENSIFADEDKLNDFIENPDQEVLEDDWVFRIAQATSKKQKEVSEYLEPFNDKRDKAERLFLKGLREMNPDALYYPDANSTMRFTYGTISGYYPADAVYYHYYTTLKGVMEKEDPDNHEFVVPEKLKELYKNKDYGIYGVDDIMYVNFISNNDITGGNSGSPVIDGNGHLIGLAFDGNWEAMSGDILFEPSVQRTINADIRYILFVIEKFAGATNLIDEMTIIK